MKFITIIFVLGTMASTLALETFQIPEEKLARLKKIADKCAEEANVDPGYIKKITDGTLPHDEAATKYLYCATTKTGVVLEDGHMSADKISDLMGDHPLKQAVKDAINKCNEVTKEDKYATMWEMNRCFTDTMPVRFLL